MLAVALSANRDLVASGGVDGTVRVWRRGDGDRLRVYQRHRGAVWSVAFTADGKTLLSGGADGLVVSHRLDQPSDEAAAPGTGARHAGGGRERARRAAIPQMRRLSQLDPRWRPPGRPQPARPVRPGRGHAARLPLFAGPAESALVWNARTIDRLFEVGPETLVPGSKMPLQRMPDPPIAPC